VDAAIERTRLLHEAAGEYIEIWGVASDDAGTQRGGLIGPDLFAEMIAPHYKRMCDWIHRHTKWKTFLHSCGSIHGYIGHWIAAGIDILNPVQISAADMEPEKLVRDFGGKVVFWGGGCDTQHVLPLEGRQRRGIQRTLAARRALAPPRGCLRRCGRRSRHGGTDDGDRLRGGVSGQPQFDGLQNVSYH
jgi:hypothetical protein